MRLEIYKTLQRLCKSNRDNEIKNRYEFDNEETWLIYLLMNHRVGPKTKDAALKRLKVKYPNSPWLCIAEQREKCRYTIQYKYKDMEECDVTLANSYNTNGVFKAIVSYKVYDEGGNKVLSHPGRRVYCEIVSTPAINEGDIDLFKGIAYADLSREVKEQILVEKIKELVEIDLKLKFNKWSPLHEVEIEIETGGINGQEEK